MKVYFADTLDNDRLICLRAANINYYLCSYYYVTDIIKFAKFAESFKSVILDSGIFTYMFGAGVGAFGIKDVNSYYDKYVEFCQLILSKYSHVIFVEMDVQKLFGSDLAWELRHRMKKDLPKANIINVYHLEDGNPDRLIEYGDYIGIGFPELRKFVSPVDRQKIVDYVFGKCTALDKKLHLLGCTDKIQLIRYRKSLSSDSSSWMKTIRFGGVCKTHGREWCNGVLSNNTNLAEGKIKDSDYYRRIYLSAKLYKQEYTRWVGSQE